ncbi:MAG: flagellar biosynthetic protein FliO [Proteobacteria bacterium]|nr:flagellar biosynthetic protein FliO [Burkholderiales bacterium]
MNRRGVRLLCAALGALAGATATAADALPPSPMSFSGVLQVVFGLALVVAAIVATGWVLRRIGPNQSAGGLLRVVGGVMVGPRERLVLVEIGEQWLVLGVAAGSVSLLHSLPKSAAGEFARASSAPQDSSGDLPWLKRWLAGAGRPR